jgi:hypothetical protein
MSTTSLVTTVTSSPPIVSTSSPSTSSSVVVVWAPSDSSIASYLDGSPITPGWDLPSLTDRSYASDDLLDIFDDLDSSRLSSSLD